MFGGNAERVNLKGDFSWRSASRSPRLERTLGAVVYLKQAIDRLSATSAATAGAAGFPDLIRASSARTHALANGGVVDRMAVTHKHFHIYSAGKLQIKFNKSPCPKAQ